MHIATKHIRDLVSFTHQSDYEIVEIAGAVIMGHSVIDRRY